MKCVQRPEGKELKKRIMDLNRHEYSAENPGHDDFEFVGESIKVEEDRHKDYENIVKMMNNNGYEQ